MAKPCSRVAALCLSACCVSFAFQAPFPDRVVTRGRPPGGALSAGPARLPTADLRIDTSLVLIPAHVTTSNGTSVTTLTKENFQLFEDGAPQTITQFAKDDAPLSIGLLFDSSGSMQNKKQKSLEAASTFFKTANTGDEFFLIQFSERPHLTVPFTPDSEEIYKRIAHTRPFGRTSLLDAIHMAMVEMKNAKNLRKAIVILSDGGDNGSRFTAREVRSGLLESDVQLYAMGIFDQADTHKLPAEEQNGPGLLTELSAQTGGRHYPVDNLNDLPAISARISQELRNQYLLGYAPATDSRDGKYHRVTVELTPPPELPDLKLYYRHGYFAPTE